VDETNLGAFVPHGLGQKPRNDPPCHKWLVEAGGSKNLFAFG
jgi:hypothetical protein